MIGPEIIDTTHPGLDSTHRTAEGLHVAFRVETRRGLVTAVSLIVEDGQYRHGTSSAVPHTRDLLGFAAAWGRCAVFINRNRLQARVL